MAPAYPSNKMIDTGETDWTAPGQPGNGQPGNGLFSELLNDAISYPREVVEQELIHLIRTYTVRDEYRSGRDESVWISSSPLVGYSVHADLEVIKHDMPYLAKHLSHQVFDLSGAVMGVDKWSDQRVKEKIYRRPKKDGYNHRAMNDVEASIERAKQLREQLYARIAP